MALNKELLKGAIEAVVLQALTDDGEAYGYELIQRIAKKAMMCLRFKKARCIPYSIVLKTEAM